MSIYTCRIGPGFTGMALLCSADCAKLYVTLAPKATTRQPAVRWKGEWRSSFCVNCHWCGKLVHEPDDCLFHGEELCELDGWVGTVDSLVFAVALHRDHGQDIREGDWLHGRQLCADGEAPEDAATMIARGV